jgi:hypothetical protein
MTELSEPKFKKGDLVQVMGFSRVYYGIVNRYEHFSIVVDILNFESDSYANQFLLQECHLVHLSEKEALVYKIKYPPNV